jgi:DNA polymerase delta subunit 2
MCADGLPTAVADKPTLVPRVLEVTKGSLCYIVGTVYMEMLLKPNVLEDLARDVSGRSIHEFTSLHDL